MRFSVTGASGFIGGYLCRELLEQGHAVRACVHSAARTAGLEELGAEIYVGDFARWDEVVGMMAGCDAVIQNGYWQGGDPIDFEKYVEYNVLGLYRMLAYCRDNGIGNFFFISSGAALGRNGVPTPQKRKDGACAPMPFDENYPAAADTEYGAYKRSGEAYVATFNRQYGMGHFTALRPMGGIMGVQRRQVHRTRLYQETWAMLHDEPVYSDIENDFATCHARDMARAALVIAERPANEAVHPLYHVVGDVHPARTVLQAIKEVAGSKSAFRHCEPAKPVTEISSAARLRELGVEFWGLDGIIEQTRELMALHAAKELPAP